MDQKAERLKQAREGAGFERAVDAARRFGWIESTYMGHENGSRGFKADTAHAYAGAFRVSPEWLLWGGNPQKDAIAETSAASRPTLVPVYDVEASAGHGAVVEYESIAYSLAFPPDYLRRLTKADPRHLSIISVKGDSMEPTLKDDDIVMLDASKTSLSFDGLFVLRYDEALHVKRIGRAPVQENVTILSDNRGLYPPLELARKEVTVIGKIIWYGRKV
jgi:phage repressor protein C with HTH and peptisase S24 domain